MIIPWAEGRDIWGFIFDNIKIGHVKTMRLVCRGAKEVIEHYKRFSNHQNFIVSIVKKKDFVYSLEMHRKAIYLAIVNEDCTIFKFAANFYATVPMFVIRWMKMITEDKRALVVFFSSGDESYSKLFALQCMSYKYKTLANHFVALVVERESKVVNAIFHTIRNNATAQQVQQFMDQIGTYFVHAITKESLPLAKLLWPYVKIVYKYKIYLMIQVILESRLSWIPWIMSLPPTKEDYEMIIVGINTNKENIIKLHDLCNLLPRLIETVPDLNLCCKLDTLRSNLEAAMKNANMKTDFLIK